MACAIWILSISFCLDNLWSQCDCWLPSPTNVFVLSLIMLLDTTFNKNEQNMYYWSNDMYYFHFSWLLFPCIWWVMSSIMYLPMMIHRPNLLASWCGCHRLQLSPAFDVHGENVKQHHGHSSTSSAIILATGRWCVSAAG